MTLAEFLSARIAEEKERAIRVGQAYEDGEHFYAPAACIEVGALVNPRTALLEAEAKQRIVEDFKALHADYRVTRDPMTEARRFQAAVAMGHLATVYADHADYSDEWRP